jgi:hypothetical protein
MFAPSSDGAMQWGDVTGDGVPESFMSVTTGAAVANAVCRQFVIPIFLPSELCEPVGGAGRFCQRSIAVPSFFLVRTICVTPTSPPMDARMRNDSSNVIFNVVRSGNYQIEDASSVSGARGTTVTFGIPLNPLFATAGEMGNRCPAGSVLLSSPALAPLGGNRLCVQTSAPPELAQVSAQLGQALSRISSNPTAESVDANVSETQSILDRVISVLPGLFACQIDPDGVTLMCVGRRGFVAPAAAILAACPVKPREDLFSACVGRGEQTTTGCAAIACIEALNDIGFAGCTAATALVVPSADLISKTAVGATVCALILRRDHFYTAPRDGTPTDICTQFESPECSLDLVLDEAIADARAAAPTVLQGRPVNGIARPPLTAPLPIDTSNPSKLYYLGNFVDLARIGLGSANTSNPITLAASRSVQLIFDGRTTRACFTTTNRTHPDHLLEGQVVNCLFDDGFGVKSLVIGTGTKTRNALANELAGPFLLGRVQDTLRGRVLARLDATRPPPPCRTCPREPL